MIKPTSIPVLIVFLLLFTACSSQSSETSESGEPNTKDSATQLEKAPDFEVTTIEGNKVSLQETLNENKPMVVYFTASWCPICAKNWPALSEVYPEYKDKLNMVAISIDPSDTKEVMKKLDAEENFTYPTTWGHPKIMVEFGVESQATTVGINRDGYIAFQKNKTALTADEYRSLFDQLVQ